MNSFKERIKPTTTVKVLESFAPDVLISPKAINKMLIFVDQCNDEIGWLGTAHLNSKTIYIDDVYLFDQEVHSTTTEITPEGLAEFGEELLTNNPEKGMEIWNNIKVWGHSHVNMGVTPSGQDDNQMKTFSEGGHEWFVRIIANKNGELKVDLFYYQLGITYLDLPWETAISREEEDIENKINALYLELDNIRKNRIKEIIDPIKDEMKAKVRKKTFVTNNYTNRGTTTTTVTTTGHGGTTNKNNKKNEANVTNINKDGKVVSATFFIKTEEDVYRYFEFDEIRQIGEAKNYLEAKETIEKCEGKFKRSDYKDFFVPIEISRIWIFSQKILARWKTVEHNNNKRGV